MARSRTSTARRYAEAAFEIAERDDTIEPWLEQLDNAAQAAADPVTGRRAREPARCRSTVAWKRSSRHSASEMLPQVRQPAGARAASPASRLAAPDRARVPSPLQPSRGHRRGNRDQRGATRRGRAGRTAQPPRADDRRQDRAGNATWIRSLLGGIQVRLGDQLIDGSVRGRLERLRIRLAVGRP